MINKRCPNCFSINWSIFGSPIHSDRKYKCNICGKIIKDEEYKK